MQDKDKIIFTVNGTEIECKKGEMLLTVLLREGFDIPHLCYHESVTPYASCRLCLVEVNRGNGFRIATSCNHPVFEGMEVKLNTEGVAEERKNVFEVLIAQAPESEKLRLYAAKWGVRETTYRIQEGDCILCGLCERVCREVIGASAITFAGRGANKELTTPYKVQSSSCIGCGACAYVCPTDSIKVFDKGFIREIPKLHAKFELVPCRICGKPVTTKEHLEFLKKTKIEKATLETCDECKKKEYAFLVASQGHM